VDAGRIYGNHPKGQVGPCGDQPAGKSVQKAAEAVGALPLPSATSKFVSGRCSDRPRMHRDREGRWSRTTTSIGASATTSAWWPRTPDAV